MDDFHVIAHRGWSEAYPENTMEAFTAATLHASVIELDVQVTADGVPVVHHDATLARCHGDDRAVGELTWKQLRDVAPSLPHLDEVLRSLGAGCGWFLELKQTGRQLEAAVRVLAAGAGLSTDSKAALRRGRALPAGTCAIESADPRVLLRMRWAVPGIGRVQLVRGSRAGRVLWLAAPLVGLYAHAIAVPRPHATRRMVRWLRRMRLGVYVYTVNSSEDAVELARWGVAAVFSDAPDRLLQGAPATPPKPAPGARGDTSV